MFLPGALTPEQLAKPVIRRGGPGDPSAWCLEVPDAGSAYCTMECYPTFEGAVAGLADWWRHGNYASFLRHPGYGRDRRSEVVASARGRSNDAPAL